MSPSRKGRAILKYSGFVVQSVKEGLNIAKRELDAAASELVSEGASNRHTADTRLAQATSWEKPAADVDALQR